MACSRLRSVFRLSQHLQSQFAAAGQPGAALGWQGMVASPAGRTLSRQMISASLRGMAADAAPAGGPEVKRGGFNMFQVILGVGCAMGLGLCVTLYNSNMPQQKALVTGSSVTATKIGDYGAVRDAISSVLDADGYDDGSYGPVLVRLAWHASGTYDKATNTGGSNGATMRFTPESDHSANNGLLVARNLLDPIKARFPWITYSDLWTLAGCVAIEEMGGPHIPWRPGRSDQADGQNCPPDGRLPDASQGAAHIRSIFGRMGFNDQEMVALSGAHTLGRCHTDRSGFEGPWTNAPTTFSNLYFQELKNRKWVKRKWAGPLQYEDKETKQLMMLPTDMALVQDRSFKKWANLYANDEEAFFKDFASAFQKLLELGVPFREGVQAA